MTELPSIVRRALEAECGNPLVEEGAVNASSREALVQVVSDAAAPSAIRQRATYLLGLWPDNETVTTMQDALNTLDERSRMAAGSVLARIHTDSALQLLGRLLEDPSNDVRRIAINALGESRLPGAAASLRRAAQVDSTVENRHRAEQLLSS